MLTIYFPFLLKIPILFKYFSSSSNMFIYRIQQFHNHFNEKLKEHKATFDPNQEPRDFMDYMLLMKPEAANEPGYSAELYDFRILQTTFEFFNDGTDTTAASLTWIFFFLALYPEWQSKLQAEINKNCDPKIPITMENRKDLPLTCAFLDEAMRFATLAPTTLEHRATVDTKLLGYDIPKNTLVMANIYAVHHDPQYWKKPDEFYPEHFLSEDKNEYQPSEKLITFSVGPRNCIGKDLVNLENFLITTSLIREFDVELCGKYSQEEIDKFLVGTDGMTRNLAPHKISFKPK